MLGIFNKGKQRKWGRFYASGVWCSIAGVWQAEDMWIPCNCLNWTLQYFSQKYRRPCPFLDGCEVLLNCELTPLLQLLCSLCCIPLFSGVEVKDSHPGSATSLTLIKTSSEGNYIGPSAKCYVKKKIIGCRPVAVCSKTVLFM